MCPCLFFRREKLKGLKLYEINPLYIKYLAQYQKHIFWSDGNKATRKYIGIVLQIDGMNYFAPLSSFKPKHTKMKESVDFIKRWSDTEEFEGFKICIDGFVRSKQVKRQR